MEVRHQAQIIHRLRRIEGQTRGLVRMVETDRYCIDILYQVQAVKSALAKVESEILKAHARSCVDSALHSGTLDERRQKISELVDLIERVKS